MSKCSGPSRSRRRWRLETLESRCLLAADLVISELMAKNESGIVDEDGEHSDWIEVANIGDTAIDIAQWALSDESDSLRKWRFPSLTLQPGDVEVVFASAKNRSLPDQPLHTNFQLDRSGEFLALVDPSGTVVHSYNHFPAQAIDVSYGLPLGQRDPADARFFAAPSPGESNPANGFLGLLDGTTVDLDHGFYEQTQTVTIVARTGGAGLAYTLDGSDPAASTSDAVVVLPTSADVPAQANLTVDRTTTLRVAEVLSDYLPSVTTTRTYVFLADVISQSADGTAPEGWPSSPINGQRFDYGMDPDVVDDPAYADLIKDALLDLPTFSVVMDRDDLFDRREGFFVNGQRARDNAREWERPTSVELIHPDGQSGFQIDAGIRMRGGFSRDPDNPKHAFRLFFRAEYGEGKLEYPLFGADGTDEFDNIDLRTAQVPSWSFCTPVSIPTRGGCQYNTMLRDVFARDLQGATGQPYGRSRFYHLYLNGHYWGVFQTQERAEASYAESYFGGDKQDYDVLKVEAFPHRVVATDGSLDAWRTLWEASVAGFRDNESYFRVQGLNEDGTRNPDFPVLLDVDNLVDYMLITLYTGNLDGPISNFLSNAQTNNWFGIYQRGGDQGFQFFVHDSEWILFDVDENRNGPWPAGSDFEQSNPQWLHQQLMQNEEYRLRFADRAQKHLYNDGILTTEAALHRFDERAQEIDLAIIAESARWGDANRTVPYTKADWLVELDRIRETILPGRNAVLIEQLRDARLANGELARLLPEFDAPQLTPGIDVRGPRPIAPGTELFVAADTSVYFTLDGTDPRQQASTLQTETRIATGAQGRYLVPSDDAIQNAWQLPEFDDASWNAATTGIGFDVRGASFPDAFATDVQADMHDVNSSIYLRLPFEVADGEPFDFAKLRIQYDDGFVAYLNGRRIASSLAEETITWESAATDTRPNATVVNFVEIDVTSHVDQLRVGSNLLAIQGLNRSRGSSDFLLLPELVLGNVIESGAGATAQLYTGPIVLPIDVERTTMVRVRGFKNGEWGPLVEQAYDTGATVGDVNRDDRFTSSDLVAIFTIGEYEDTLVANSSWDDGDWNGDGEFTSSDLVLAFQLGTYTV